MPEFPRIAIVNTGWSDDYQGDRVVGNFGYLQDGVGHERYNFLPDVDGHLYGYAPPLGKHWSAPNPVDTNAWLVFFVSKRPKRSGLYLVGWYENANFLGEYRARPDADRFGPDSDGGQFLYTVTSTQGFLVPLPLRQFRVKGDHLKRSYAYLRGTGDDEPWRGALAHELLSYRQQLIKLLGGESDSIEQKELPIGGDAKHRKKVETAAVEAVKRHLSEYAWESKEADKCGYDLLFTHKTSGEVLHVEVKGTSLPAPGYFLTQKELGYAESLEKNDHRARRDKSGIWRPLWRIAVVSGALDQPQVRVFTLAEMKSAFDMAPYAWRGTLKETA